jgi:hypothetical protein
LESSVAELGDRVYKIPFHTEDLVAGPGAIRASDTFIDKGMPIVTETGKRRSAERMVKENSKSVAGLKSVLKDGDIKINIGDIFNDAFEQARAMQKSPGTAQIGDEMVSYLTKEMDAGPQGNILRPPKPGETRLVREPNQGMMFGDADGFVFDKLDHRERVPAWEELSRTLGVQQQQASSLGAYSRMSEAGPKGAEAAAQANMHTGIARNIREGMENQMDEVERLRPDAARKISPRENLSGALYKNNRQSQGLYDALSEMDRKAKLPDGSMRRVGNAAMGFGLAGASTGGYTRDPYAAAGAGVGGAFLTTAVGQTMLGKLLASRARLAPRAMLLQDARYDRGLESDSWKRLRKELGVE